MRKAKHLMAGLLAAALTVTNMPLTAAAEIESITWGTKPEDGTTKNQPFPSGTGGSQKFRIPGIVTLDDGTLVASSDARWDHGGDACGLDTIVSRSTDNGKNWSYTFANYLGDYGNQKHLQATAFIDPSITTDGENLYMIADIFPGGYGLNTAPNGPRTGNEFDENGNLLLSGDKRGTFTYHLEKNTGEDADEKSYYVIKDNTSGDIVEGYTIDAYFNIKDGTGETNLFCDNSPYLVYPTDYLYLTTSKDGGATWSIPSLLNLKKPTEQTLLVGPGRGIVTSRGRIVFTVYEFTNGDRNSACIYSDDDGRTWKRGESVPQVSSEAAVVEVDEKLYIFTRHGGYNVSEDWGETWSEVKTPEGITYHLSCELSAITYSKKIDGRTAIILSAPSNPGGRSAGKLFVGLVQEDGSISWDYQYSVNGSDYYAYSCLTELKDGSIGLLFEDGGASIRYETIDISDIAPGALIGDLWCEDEEGSVVTSIHMQPESTVDLNVFQVGKDDITAVSDDANLLNVNLKNGKLKIASGKIIGSIDSGTVTVSSKTETCRIRVIVAPKEQHEVINLRMGDTCTIPAEGEDSIWIQDDRIVKVKEDSAPLTIEALKEGKSEMQVGSAKYYFIVENDIKNLKLHRGQKILLPGANLQKEADSSVVSVTKNTSMGSYKKAGELTAGERYVIGTATSIITSGRSELQNPTGRAMRSVDFDEDDLSDFEWTLKVVGEGFSLQNQSGQCLNFENPNGASCDVTVSDTEQPLNVTKKGSGFSIGCTLNEGDYYLNNYSNANVRAAGYSSDNNTWYFYQPTQNFIVKGLAEGSTSVAISGITYLITVEGFGTAQEVQKILKDTLEDADVLLKQSGLEAIYTEESIKKLREMCQSVQDILNSAEELEMEKLKNALAGLEKAMKLEKKPAPVQKDDNLITDLIVEKLPQPGSIQIYNKAKYIVTSSTAAGGTVTYKEPEKKSQKKIKIPNTIQIDNRTYKVTEIASKALKGTKNLTEVTIGTNIVKIGSSAFEKCGKLKKIVVNTKKLKSVGKKALKGIHKKCVIKVPKKKKAEYKKYFKKAGMSSSVKIK